MSNFYIQQSIHIQLIKIGGVSNSSVFQIGSAGIIKPSSHLYNTGGFTEPAPEFDTPLSEGTVVGTPFVPLVAPAKP
ncbi:spore germination protein GerPB [Cytobacillus purgationiresistens]|uniref:Spore germination protein PB n=1 Tax=Cytobacillus purgationiresistens TaxID=863449 RepID=A0ABU0ADC2_9BACI|nr:spore germination protein GerPB [Cytobacillus purgationiresistens]MDQ0268792.1 spore germination protein PB [Cytobacillus purgationiresistens]